MIFVFLLTFGMSAFSYLDTYYLATSGSADTGDFTYLADRISHTPYSGVEDFLQDWKSQRPKYFSNYVMAYRSRSLQHATAKFPRVILFNSNADVVMSFNGHENHRGFKNIELMRFNHKKNGFEFYEMSFNNNRAQLSEPNPVKCLECHQGSQRQGVDPRPNWEPYNAWLGFYGSIDDSTSTMKSRFLEEDVRDDERAFIAQELDSEDEWYARFWKDIQPNNQRYVLLDPVERVQQVEATINGDFTNRLAALNYRRIARLMVEQKEVFEFVKWTLWGNVVCNDKLFVAPEVYELLKKSTPRPEVRVAEITPSYATPSNPQVRLRISLAINLLFEPFLVNTEDWSMDFKTQGRFAAFERFGLTNDPRPIVRKSFERFFFKEQDFRSMTCDELKTKSMENFGSVEKVQAFLNRRKQNPLNVTVEKPLLQRCISCHVDESVFGMVPAIPFNDPARLKTLLHQGIYKRGTLFDEILYRTGAHAGQSEQMPPRGIPSNEQRQELIQYLESL
jgi:hypothetical protein